MSTSTSVAVIGLAVAWLLYRLERSGVRHREIESASAVLLAVKRGMVGGHDGEPGWGERYFSRNWTEEEAAERARSDVNSVMERHYSQVLVVPTTPLDALIGSAFGGDLISDETLYYANVGLWHIAVFNQLVGMQDALLSQHLSEIFDEDLNVKRRYAIAEAIGSHGRMLHRRGVGEPVGPNGWYLRLSSAVDSDIDRLVSERAKRLYPSGEQRLIVGDLVALVAAAVTVGTLLARHF